MSRCASRCIALLAVAALAVVATPACDGDSTPAAGLCVVAFQDVANAYQDLANHDNANPSRSESEAIFRRMKRTVYWCDDVPEWRAGFNRFRHRLDGPSITRAELGFLLALVLCSRSPENEAPVCRDVDDRGIRPRDVFGNVVAVEAP